MDRSIDYRVVVEELLESQVGPRPASSDVLDITSLELVRLLVGLEDRLGIQLDDVAIMNISLETTDDLVALLERSVGVDRVG